MNKITMVKNVKSTGTSLIIHITKEIQMLGLGKGDIVQVTLQKIPPSDNNKEDVVE